MSDTIIFTEIKEIVNISAVQEDAVVISVTEETINLNAVEGGISDVSWVFGELALGDVDNENCDFSTTLPYILNSLKIFWNGVLQGAGDYEEVDPAKGTFSVTVAPVSDGQQTDEIRYSYRI